VVSAVESWPSWCRRGEHGVEGPAVLGVPVADEEPERGYSVSRSDRVAGGLRGPCHCRVGGDAEDVDPAAGDLHDEQQVDAAQFDGGGVEEVGGQQPGCLGSEECAPVGVCPARCGPRRAVVRTRRMVLAPMRCPSRVSSTSD
jgi:hypothetical protein